MTVSLEAPAASRTLPEFSVIIPARYASTRLPAKALADLGGKPMVMRVAERARAAGAAAVWVATDHPDILRAAEAHGVSAMMTRSDHASGTDRIAEVAARLGLADEAIVVNVQGDEPAIPADLIGQVAATLASSTRASLATACHAVSNIAELTNPNVVKVVRDRAGDALYFSRSVVPYDREAFAQGTPTVFPNGLPAYRHIGIYAYRAGFLREYTGLVAPAIERCEALEQLRALWHGYRIAVLELAQAPHAGVDTPADLERMRKLFAMTG